MPLSGLPGNGPTIPDGAQRVSITDTDTSNTPKVDVTVLEDTSRQYDDAPLKTGNDGTPTATCTASGLLTGDPPEVDVPQAGVAPDGWLCDEAEVSYNVGEYATWSATWNYYGGGS